MSRGGLCIFGKKGPRGTKYLSDTCQSGRGCYNGLCTSENNRPTQVPEREEKEGAHMYDTHIFLDFEMNPIPREYREAREIARSEIVEIGAVKLDREYRLVDRYSCYVKPEYGPIHKRITQLTGITDADVAGAKSFAPAMEDFAAWIGEGRGRIYSWSRSDQYQLYDESWLKEAELPWQLNQRWIDFQAVYTRLIGLSRSNPLSLQNALGAAEYRFAGEAHRAVQDAENSASLLILVKEGRLAQQAGVVMQAMRPKEEHSFALGGEAAEKLRQFLASQEQG